jgi:hypothetical protein
MNIQPDLRREDMLRVQRPALGVGVVALIVCVIGALFDPAQFFRAYLSAYYYFLGLGLGCMAVLMIYHLTGGAWGYLIRRPLEAGARTLPLLAVLFIPVGCGLPSLYLWADPDAVAKDRNLQYKQVYLNAPFWWGRAVLFFVLWLALAWLLNYWSRRQDETGDPRLARWLAKLSGPGLAVYGISFTFAAVDWLMSLQPSFHSTIFGPLCASGHVLCGLALAVLVLARLVMRPPVAALISIDALNDLGSLLFSFLVIWSYMVWFQFMLIWIANLPTDVIWYVVRTDNGWEYVALLLCVFHFTIPFFLLLARDIKRNPRALGAVAALLLLMQLVYSYYLVMPAFVGTGLAEHWMDFLTPLAVGGLWLAYYLWQVQRYPLLPRHDENAQSAVHLRDIDREAAAREREVQHG